MFQWGFMNYIVYDFWIHRTRQRFQSEWDFILPPSTQTLSSTFVQLDFYVKRKERADFNTPNHISVQTVSSPPSC